MSEYKPGDRVVLIDVSRGRLGYTEGMQATVIEHENGRLYVQFDGDEQIISGNERRFRKVTKLDEALK